MRVSFLQRALCLGISVAAVAAVAAPAQAASPFVRDTALCPTGKVVVGGGSAVVGQGTADFKTSMYESAPGTIGGGAQSLWLTALRNNDVSPHTIGMFAVCAKFPTGYQVVRKDVTVPAGGFVRDVATCPRGKVVLAGGTQVVGEGTANFNTRMQESAPGTVGFTQSVWLTALRNVDRRPHTIGMFAVCATAPAGYQVVRKDYSVPANGFLRNTAICPDGKIVMGSGASVIGEGTANFNTRLQELAPGTIGGGAQSLALAALHNHAGRAHTIGVHAVCASPLSGYEVVRKDVVAG